eukprot:TRINITY_DN13880_c0_g1_i2.p3 TRINITY_DN13880_c0_g1~~TRINITY_DN13880_c0_g1_i2.p3  ORF type:complete len:116 (-),score=16.04 TRINITY_DN13880_c0_g1_i2:177-524(-)
MVCRDTCGGSVFAIFDCLIWRGCVLNRTPRALVVGDLSGIWSVIFGCEVNSFENSPVQRQLFENIVKSSNFVLGMLVWEFDVFCCLDSFCTLVVALVGHFVGSCQEVISTQNFFE